MSDDLRRVLTDPAHRLPDSLVDLDDVHSAVRRTQLRRTVLAAVGGVAVVVALGAAVVHPWSATDGSLPAASTGPTPSVVLSPTAHASPPVSPSTDPPGTTPQVERVVGVSATSDTSWWVLGSVGSTQDGVPLLADVQLLRTTDGGATFSVVSRSGDPGGIPAGSSTVRFLGDGVGYALRANAKTGDQVWRTVDDGRTWGVVTFPQRVLALEAGGGTGWLLAQDGRRIGVAAIPSGSTQHVEPTVWLGSGSGVDPALTVQGGEALVFWFTEAASRLSVVASGGGVQDRVDPCTRDVGVGSVSATADGLAVSCHLGTSDGAYGSDDGGRTWALAPTDGGGRLVVGSINAGAMAVGRQDGRLTLALSDSTQPIVTSGADGTGAWTWIGFTSQTSGFALDEAGRLFHTDQRGTSWTRVAFGS